MGTTRHQKYTDLKTRFLKLNNYIQKSILTVVVIASLLICAPGLKAQINAEQMMTIGRNVMSMEDYMLSIQYFNQAIKAKPYLSDPYFFRALAKLYLEDYKGAEEDCTLALERNRFKTETYKVRGFVRQNMGKDSLAIEDYNKGLEYNPEEKYFLFYKALAQTDLKQNDGAEETFARLLRIYPNFEEGYAARGRLRVMQGDTVGALADLDKSISISRNQTNALLLRAGINADRMHWAEAAEDMDAAIKLKPQEADLYINRAYLRYNMDDYFGAMSDYNYTLELEPYNATALFNRALLRYEVKDLNRAAADLEKVLQYEPDNFHARYNLGLVNMERGEHQEALRDLDIITRKYPRFYPAYYAKAEVFRDMGNMRAAMQQAHTGDDLVSRYVSNPEKNPLDRPVIASGKTRSTKEIYSDEEENEIEVMNRFNQLVTVGDAGTESQLSYNEKIKGRVQDRNLRVEPEPSYFLSMMDSPASLHSTSNYFRELDDFNQRHYITDHIYLAGGTAPMDEKAMQNLFSRADYYDGIVNEPNPRGADLLALGVLRSMLKNYPAAVEAFDRALERDPDFTIAYIGRAVARQNALHTRSVDGGTSSDDAASVALRQREIQKDFADIIADYDRALQLNPRLVYAWLNKGNLYYEAGDYTSALQCYSEALKLDPSFGAACYNRGITYLQIGNKRLAFTDLSKAGELGILPSYNLLKRMK